jgi:sterol desaturase/sphingolipid hydroxylase (fatty acid hydroxylase superfamily)
MIEVVQQQTHAPPVNETWRQARGIKATADMASGHVICVFPIHRFCTVIPTYLSTNTSSSLSFLANTKCHSVGYSTPRTPRINTCTHLTPFVCIFIVMTVFLLYVYVWLHRLRLFRAFSSVLRQMLG